MNATGPLSPNGLRDTGRRTFAALAVPNYRRYFFGQATSLVGTWMQMAAQSWLVLSLTGSAAALGLIVALQTLPVLLLAPYGGVIADRVDKRRLMVVLQTAMGLQALTLGVLTITGSVRIWEIGVLAVVLGLNNAFENPARQSFVLEMVGAETLRNAVSLNSVQVNVARAVGPAVAGVLIATVGTGECFLINAASFVAVVGSLLSMERSTLHPTPPAPRAAGQLREGLRYARATPEIIVPLAMMALVGTLAYEFQVSLPVMARPRAARRGGGLRLHDRGDGRGSDRRRTGRRGARPHRPAPGDHRGRGLRGRAGPRRAGADARRRADRAGAGRRRERLVHVKRQLDAPAGCRPRDARPRDGAVVRRVAGHHADRRAADRRRSSASPARERAWASARSRACSRRASATEPGDGCEALAAGGSRSGPQRPACRPAAPASAPEPSIEGGGRRSRGYGVEISIAPNRAAPCGRCT